MRLGEEDGWVLIDHSPPASPSSSSATEPNPDTPPTNHNDEHPYFSYYTPWSFKTSLPRGSGKTVVISENTRAHSNKASSAATHLGKRQEKTFVPRSKRDPTLKDKIARKVNKTHRDALLSNRKDMGHFQRR